VAAVSALDEDQDNERVEPRSQRLRPVAAEVGSLRATAAARGSS